MGPSVQWEDARLADARSGFDSPRIHRIFLGRLSGWSTALQAELCGFDPRLLHVSAIKASRHDRLRSGLDAEHQQGCNREHDQSTRHLDNKTYNIHLDNLNSICGSFVVPPNESCLGDRCHSQSGPLYDIGCQGARGSARSPGMREGSARPRVAALQLETIRGRLMARTLDFGSGYEGSSPSP